MHGRLWQAFAKIEVGAMGFIGQHFHAMGMGDLNDGFQIGADAIVCWIVHKHCLGVWMGLDGRFDILHLHAKRNP